MTTYEDRLDQYADDLAEAVDRERHDRDCRCPLCGPNPFEMRAAERARELEVAR